MTGKRFRKVRCHTASSEDRIDPLSGGVPSHLEVTGSDNTSLVQSIRENHANFEKIASYEWEDMENQDPGDVF